MWEKEVYSTVEDVALIMSMTGKSEEESKNLLATNNHDIKEAISYLNNSQEFVLPPSLFKKLKGFENGKNTCYIDSILFPMFARQDFYDNLLLKPIEAKRLQTYLRVIVNQLREGELVSCFSVNRFRNECIVWGWIEGTGQQDAVEFMLFICQILSVSLISMKEDLFHGGLYNMRDENEALQQILCLPAIKSVHLQDLMSEYFFDNIISGVERQIDIHDSTRIKAWKMMKLVGNYSDQIIPIMLKRYVVKNGELEKTNSRIEIPFELDFSHFITSNLDSTNSHFILQLVGVTVHKGPNMNSGHYVSYIPEYQQSKLIRWIQHDDLDQCRVKEVSSLKGMSDLFQTFSTSGYILFYKILLLSDSEFESRIGHDFRFATKIQREFDRFNEKCKIM